GIAHSVRRVSLERSRRTRSATPLFHIRGRLPGTGLLLMRLVIGSVLVVRAGLRLWGDPPLNITVTSAILLGSGILLILGLWTPIVGTVVALVEAWKILTLPGDRWL